MTQIYEKYCTYPHLPRFMKNIVLIPIYSFTYIYLSPFTQIRDVGLANIAP